MKGNILKHMANECLGKLCFLSKRDYVEARVFLQNRLGMSKNKDCEINKMLGIIAFSRAKYEESIMRFNLSHDCLSQDGLFTFAMSSLMIKDFEKARVYMKDFLNIQKNFKPAEFVLNNISNDHNAHILKEFITKEVHHDSSSEVIKNLSFLRKQESINLQHNDNKKAFLEENYHDKMGITNPFLNEGNYWALPPMMIFAIPKHIWDKKDLIFNQ